MTSIGFPKVTTPVCTPLEEYSPEFAFGQPGRWVHDAGCSSRAVGHLDTQWVRVHSPRANFGGVRQAARRLVSV